MKTLSILATVAAITLGFTGVANANGDVADSCLGIDGVDDLVLADGTPVGTVTFSCGGIPEVDIDTSLGDYILRESTVALFVSRDCAVDNDVRNKAGNPKLGRGDIVSTVTSRRGENDTHHPHGLDIVNSELHDTVMCVTLDALLFNTDNEDGGSPHASGFLDGGASIPFPGPSPHEFIEGTLID